MKNTIVGRKINISGIVQGVGFRPFLYALAKSNQITGWVRNSSSGVEIIVNGESPNIHAFIKAIPKESPPLSRIDSIDITEIAPDGFSSFKIIQSISRPGDFIPVSPDVAICEDCINELFDPSNRRYRYPFINCTNCGPRFSIIRDIPYDRPMTTMASFTMCESCQKEYDDPLDRRFHAQPTACDTCGPQIWFESRLTENIFGEDGLRKAREWIIDGKIIAVKGLGGFHLVCSAFDENALATLRQRKKRTDKPFALMANNSAIVANYCKLSDSEKLLLESREKPIVILERNKNSYPPDLVAPYTNTLGVMLPYTPLHYLLMEPAPDFPELLVMTSGNLSEEPIAYTNESAKSALEGIADAFILNNRDIETRVDDSVLMNVNSRPYMLRRSRGYAPNSIPLKTDTKEILAVGAELKNTFCLTKNKYAFLSYHIGDLQNLETFNAFHEGITHFEKLFKINPAMITCDLHPDYLPTQYAQRRSADEGLPLIRIQHHHAHLAACMAENLWEMNEPVIGVCFDGTGYGVDGHIWGGEFFFGCYGDFSREYHLAYMPLPGGDSAIKLPKKMAAAYLWKAGIEWDANIPSLKALDQEEQDILLSQLEKQINCPLTSSVGRLFDVIASLIGIRQEINYEAQAAIELENAIDPNIEDAYLFEINENIIDPAPIIKKVLNDMMNKKSIAEISAKFHNSIRRLILDICLEISNRTGCRNVALSGGVMQNRYLINHIINDLNAADLHPLFHQKVPANDGGISLGQAVIANLLNDQEMR